MGIIRKSLSAVAVLALLLALAAGPARAQDPGQDDVLFQVSVIDALLDGVYDGDFSCGQLVKHGDLGLGTFNNLDGEMVVVDGVVYQIRMDGRAYRVPGETLTPFADITFFKADQVIEIKGEVDFKELAERLDQALPSENVFYAIRIRGRFPHVKVRSVPRQQKPYPKLVKAVEGQAVFNHDNIEGDLVGFRSPAYVKGVNVTGYHLHFIDAARQRGGHVLDMRLKDAVVEVDYTPQFELVLPGQGSFLEVDLSGDKTGQVHKVEK